MIGGEELIVEVVIRVATTILVWLITGGLVVI